MIEYRLYYDNHGRVITYATKNLPGKYIVITREEFAESRMDVTVSAEGKIIRQRNSSIKLEKSTAGIRCHKYDVNIIVQDNDIGYLWGTAIYERT